MELIDWWKDIPLKQRQKVVFAFIPFPSIPSAPIVLLSLFVCVCLPLAEPLAALQPITHQRKKQTKLNFNNYRRANSTKAISLFCLYQFKKETLLCCIRPLFTVIIHFISSNWANQMKLFFLFFAEGKEVELNWFVIAAPFIEKLKFFKLRDKWLWVWAQHITQLNSYFLPSISINNKENKPFNYSFFFIEQLNQRRWNETIQRELWNGILLRRLACGL